MPRLTLFVSLIIAFILFAIAPVSADDALNLPKEKITGGLSANDDVVRDYLLRQAEHEVARWRAEYDKLITSEEIAAYQKRMQENVLTAIGGLPERTPLEPRITGTVERLGYRVEKVLFQSRPKHYVTALLFMPDAERFEPPYSGVLIPCGHSKNGKGRDVYQTAGALFALNGMAALVFDPIDRASEDNTLAPAAGRNSPASEGI